MVSGAQTNTAWSEQENAVELMQVALGHYANHREIVLRKIELAQQATARHKYLQNLEKAPNFLSRIKVRCVALKPQKKDSENPMWAKVKSTFSQKTIFEDDLFFIEEMLEKMPKDIKTIYKEYVAKDKELKTLVSKVDAELYKDAKRRIASVQNCKNPLTGRSAEDYEDKFLQEIKQLLFSD